MILGIAAMIHTNIIQNRMVSDRRYRFSNKEKMLSLVPDRFEQLWRFPERTEEGKEGLSNHFSLGNFCKSLKDVGMISCNLTSRQIAHLVERSLSKRPLWLQISTGVFFLVAIQTIGHPIQRQRKQLQPYRMRMLFSLCLLSACLILILSTKE